MRFGLHWGSTIYMGNIGTLARSEVTALGDEVNEAARIEACATGGRPLASKPLVERLTNDDATRLGIPPEHLAYVQLANLTAATDKSASRCAGDRGVRAVTSMENDEAPLRCSIEWRG